LLKRCIDGDGDAALQACKSVLVKGAPNEFETTVRIALLQQSTNQASQALDSYIAANSLRHGDKGVALAVLALLQSTQRKDAIALAARGSSLVTLGRAHEALASLRQAKALQPELPDLDQQIKAAEALARTESTVHKERPIQVADRQHRCGSHAGAAKLLERGGGHPLQLGLSRRPERPLETLSLSPQMGV
jgi:tetratricopeptide (TPR) repeat protein